MRIDPEIQEYRDLMAVPEEFEDGFNIKTIIGMLFLAFVIMPGSIYLGLVAGSDLGPAAEWTTIILFAEIARRSFTRLTRQELYILYYVAGSLISMSGGTALAGGAFAGFIWNQYLRQSAAAEGFGIRDQIPNWIVPPFGSEALINRTFFHRDWLVPIGLMLIYQILSRLSWFGFGYALFHITSDIEKLPFPFAPIAAQGATALAEITSKEETWRWRVFSIGSMIGIVFGAFYVGIPSLSGAILSKPIQLLPIPFLDLTLNTEGFLPATPTGITLNLGAVLSGLIVPFWVVIGSVASCIITMIVNPMLYHRGILTHWRPGMDTIQTGFANSVDFYLSWGIGIALAVAVIGFYSVGQTLITDARTRRERSRPERDLAAARKRGTMPLWLAVGMWAVATLTYIIICRILIPNFPWIFFVIFGFVITPLESYVSARLIGIAGQSVGIPFLREASFILSGYKGIDIWFAPIPYSNYGGLAASFRVIELTGTKLISVVKAELWMLPIMLISSFLFWSFMWKLAPIPSQAYPYAQKMWHLSALSQCLWLTATVEGHSYLMDAIKPTIIGISFGFGVIAYIVLYSLGWPVMLVYGIVRGLGTQPHGLLPEIVGALAAKFYFHKRFGRQQWRLYATVLMAGFACGMGLIGMFSVAIAMISKSVTQLPF